jgi:hypothetical protein
MKWKPDNPYQHCCNSVGAERLLTVEEIAEVLRVRTSWIYRHAAAIGGLKLGKYWRFQLDRVLATLSGGLPHSEVGSAAQRPNTNHVSSASSKG